MARTEKENEPMELWLNEYTKKSVREGNKSRMNTFLKWCNKTPKQLVKEFDQKKVKQMLLQFQTYLLTEHFNKRTKQKGLSQNTTRTHINTIRGFYSSQCEPIRGLKRKIVKAQLPKGEHRFDIQDLKSMFAIADTRDKAIVSLSCSLGWEASAFLGIEKDFIEKLVRRAKSKNQDFISFEWQRSKTSAKQFGILTPITLLCLERYIEKLDKENPNQKQLFDLTPNGLNVVLKNLVHESGIATIGKIRFHLIRKWLMQALVNAGLSSFEVKLILGKAIQTADLTYLQALQKSSFEKYRKAYPLHLSLTQDLNGTAKYSELVDLVVRHVKAQEHLVEYMQEKGLLKMIPSNIQTQLKNVSEFASIMSKKNGKKPREEGSGEES